MSKKSIVKSKSYFIKLNINLFRNPNSVNGQTELLWNATTSRQIPLNQNTADSKKREQKIETLGKKDPTVDLNDNINRGIKFSSLGSYKLKGPQYIKVFFYKAAGMSTLPTGSRSTTFLTLV